MCVCDLIKPFDKTHIFLHACCLLTACNVDLSYLQHSTVSSVGFVTHAIQIKNVLPKHQTCVVVVISTTMDTIFSAKLTVTLKKGHHPNCGACYRDQQDQSQQHTVSTPESTSLC